MAHPIRAVQRHDLRFYVYRDDRDEYRWRLIARDDQQIAISAEGYVNRADCVYALNLVVGGSGIPIEFAPGLADVNEPF
jgi:uncharacterized protein YegP (UPF0339 family)